MRSAPLQSTETLEEVQKRLEPKAAEYLARKKQENPVNYMSVLKKEYRELQKEKESVDKEVNALMAQLQNQDDENEKIQRELERIQDEIAKLKKTNDDLSRKMDKDKLSADVMESNLRANLNDYISLEKYKTIKSLFSKFKITQKKGPPVQACLVLYFLEDFINGDEGLFVPYLVSDNSPRTWCSQ